MKFFGGQRRKQNPNPERKIMVDEPTSERKREKYD